MEESKPFTFKLPSLLVCSGSTGAGKSYLTAEILHARNEIIEPAPRVVIWVYNIYQQELFDRIRDYVPDVVFVHGMDDFYAITFSPGIPHLVVLDDQMT